jgi:hypothetical protein
MSEVDDGSSSDSDSSVASSVSIKSLRTPANFEDGDSSGSQTQNPRSAFAITVVDKPLHVGSVDEFTTPTASSKKKVVRRTNLQIQADNAAKSSEKVVKISKASKKLAKKSTFDHPTQSENTERVAEKADQIPRVSSKQEKDSKIESSATVTHVTVNGVIFPLQAAKTVWTTVETLDLIKVLCNSPTCKYDAVL